MDKPQFIALILQLLLVYLVNYQAYGDSEYISCIPGDLNIILSAPHGGTERLEDLPNRDAGCYVDGACVWTHNCTEKNITKCRAVVESDFNTRNLTLLLSDHLNLLTNQRPTVVINNLHRLKLDANRDLDQATFGLPVAVEAWEAYQGCINEAKARIEASGEHNGMGLFLDVHGQSHRDPFLELGYAITGRKLDAGSFEADDSSIRHLASLYNGRFETLLRGKDSMGHFLEEEGYLALPSPKNPSPNGRSYFDGRLHNTVKHGSMNGGKIDAIQMESHISNRVPDKIEAYSLALAKAIVKFRQVHYLKATSRASQGFSEVKLLWISLVLIAKFMYSMIL